MTRSKFNRLVKQLIDKYGDVVVTEYYDYYKYNLIHKDGKQGDYDVVAQFTLSDYIDNDFIIPNRAAIESLEMVAKGVDKTESVPVTIEESKTIYDSDEQVKLRKNKKDKFQSLFGAYTIASRARDDYSFLVRKFEDWKVDSLSPKEFGMYLSNHKRK